MRADSRRARDQKSTSSHGAGATFWIGLALCAVLAAAGCKNASFAKADLDGGGGRDGHGSDIAQPNTCSPETPSQSKGKTESCSCDRECQTGFCVDGICCNKACTETCKACNLASSLGDCALVPSGVKPSVALQCVASTPATCGLDGTCDGKGGCRQFVKDTPCKGGTCDGAGVTGILTCDGNGKCSGATSLSCPPWTCDPNAIPIGCTSTCTTDAQCATGHQCVSGRCGKSPNGAVCKTGDDCSSTFCVRENPQAVNGVCCDVACSGACMSCDQTGSKGQCSAIPAGLGDPACLGGDASTCGKNGLCDGFGACTFYPQNTVCGPSSCSGLFENTPRTCDGKGTCRDSQLVDCSPFLCTNNSCVKNCTSDNDCQAGHQCVQQTTDGGITGVCGKRKNGQSCPDSSQCESGQCVDGVCCENSCTGACRSCNLPGSPGQCLNAASGAPDPRDTCQDLGATACSTNGLCDGNGACQSYPSGTVCGSQSCVAGAYTPPSTCNTAGQCIASHSRTCNPFICNGDVCYDICTSDTQCVAGNYCVDASCGLKPWGAKCGKGTECQSGFCAQGACCDSACTTACMACNLNAAPGRCTAVADKSPDPQNICTVTLSNTCGTTGSCLSGKCAYHDRDTNCKAAICADTSSVIPASTCDGEGACITPATHTCDTFICATDACKTTCTKDADCVTPNTCASNSCGLKMNGAACTQGIQCQSGFCTEGVCCVSACADGASGLCKTCKGTATTLKGDCGDVDSGDSDPKGRCAKSDVANGHCDNDGTCNGSGACRAWPSGTGCRKASCADGAQGSVETASAACDSKGSCPDAKTTPCYDFLCYPSGGSPTCRTSCTSNSDCFATTCNLATNHCGDKQGINESCVIDTDCGSGHCVQGSCCSNACPPPADGGVGVCGNTGACNTQGACITYPTCSPSITSCPDSKHQYNLAGQCDYTGASPKCDLVTSTCATGYLCTAGTNACATGCQDDSSCDTAGGYYCLASPPSSALTCRKPVKGDACVSPTRTCPSGLYCVDGYCCNSSCTGSCMACNLSGTVGTCSAVKNAADNDTCAINCKSGNQFTSGCNGSGSCVTAACPSGNVCLNGTQCAGGCTQTGCATGYYCSAIAGTVCQAQLAQGHACSGEAGECAGGGFCVDGVCCNTSCTGACLACNLVGTGGTCSAVKSADDANTCTGANTCDASGLCKKKPGIACTAAGDCASASCTDGFCCTQTCGICQDCTGSGGTCVAVKNADDASTCTGANTCDASGLCKKKPGIACLAAGDCASGSCTDSFCCTQACGPCQACTGTGGTCVAVKNADDPDSCTTPNTCDGNGYCKRKAGQACGGTTECASAHCADGVCCDSDCTGVCMACNSSGTCTPVTSGTDNLCPVACNVSTNQYTPGQCGTASGGVGQCAPAVACPNGNVCASATECASDCSTSGRCATGSFCDGSTCHAGTTCTASPGCASGFYCDGTASCKLKLVKGANCTNDLQCSTPFCVDDVCCDTACTGACMACNLGSSPGTCSPVTSGTDNSCLPVTCSGNIITNGQCGTASGGTGQCAANACANGNVCADGSHCATDCSGTGACASGYYCDGGTCRSGSCTGPSGCASGYYCDGTCKAKLDNGASCSNNGQCKSTFCADNVCCNSDCRGACMACNLGASPGTCSPVTSGADNLCLPVTCSGNMITNGQCGTASGGTGQCAANACADGNICLDGNQCAPDCSGTGACASGYYCDGGTCRSGSCTGPSGCASGYYCDGTCKAKLDNGASCSNNGQCKSTFCADNVCCNSDCRGACMACNLGASPGTCSPVTSGADNLCLPVTCSGNMITNGQCGTASGGTGQCAANACADGNICLDGNQCAPDCSGTGACASGYLCVDGACQLTGP